MQVPVSIRTDLRRSHERPQAAGPVQRLENGRDIHIGLAVEDNFPGVDKLSKWGTELASQIDPLPDAAKMNPVNVAGGRGLGVNVIRQAFEGMQESSKPLDDLGRIGSFVQEMRAV